MLLPGIRHGLTAIIPPVVFRGANAASSGISTVSSLDLPLPSYAEGDYAVIAAVSRRGSSSSPRTISAPSGWDLLGTSTVSGNSDNPAFRFSIFGRYLPADIAAVTLTQGSALLNAGVIILGNVRDFTVGGLANSVTISQRRSFWVGHRFTANALSGLAPLPGFVQRYATASTAIFATVSRNEGYTRAERLNELTITRDQDGPAFLMGFN